MNTLKDLRKNRNLSIELLSNILNIPSKFIEAIESNDYPKAICYTIKLSKYFDVSIDSLLEAENSFSNYEIKVLNLFRKLSINDKLKIEGMIEYKLSENKAEGKQLKKITLYRLDVTKYKILIINQLDFV
ncbi:helix-turn-helix domain-containing protein [Clostridium oryzae]|uniref:Helix-turn-helix domain protein n=1 Tax=Clostridium oryzae TaxID=1450648 RepID=A0A1V4IPW3_9CLOT|nr:helix-turn-helix domain-containing protein [Clostridium oryzae]OPJ61507.1 helix-turn-helix domain protein [Clostridium oryzae]